MLKKIIHFSVHNKLIIGLFTVALIVYGIFEVTRLPIDAVPDITDNQVQVITVSPSLGAPDIERLVTFPIEQANSNLPGLKQIRSFSRFGLSVITIVFEDNVDVYWARQQVAERLQQVQSAIPAAFGKPELAPVTTGLGEIYQYVVRPKPGYEGKYDLAELRSIQDWIVRRQLLGTKGIADVASFGGKLKQYEVAVNPYKLTTYGLTIDDVFTALQKNNENTGGAYIEKGPTVLFIRSEGLVQNVEDLRKVVVKVTASGAPIRIADVGDVRFGSAIRYGAMTYNDVGEVSGAVVMMLKGENSSAVIKRVKEKIAIIQKTLPEGVLIEPFLDRTKMVNNAISTVKRNLMEGALIVVFVLVLFLGNFRAGLLVASVIPLAMLFAIILMNLFGVSGNLMSLGALDFGLIVDGAVIIVEAVMHRLAGTPLMQGAKRIAPAEMDRTVESSASRMMNAAVFGQIIILIVYLPVFTLQGIEGKMFRPMAQTVTFALIGAFLLSLTYVPMMSALVLPRNPVSKKRLNERLMERLENSYGHLLTKLLRKAKWVVLSSIGLFAIAVWLLTRLGGEFIPKLEEGDFAVDTRLLTGSNLTASRQALIKAAHLLKTRFPEVEKVVGKNGSSEIPTDPMAMDASDLMVILKDKTQWKNAKTFDELAKKMQDTLQEIPGVTFGFQYPVQMRFNELISGARQDVVCKIFGEDLDTLASTARKLGTIINGVKGAADLYVETVTGMPQAVVSYNREAIAQYGLAISDVNRAVNTAFAGQSAGLVFEQERRFDLVVRLDTAERKNLTDIQNLLIATPGGQQIPLRQVANVQISEGPNQIQREQAKRRIIVGFNVRGRDVKTVVQELQKKVDASLKLPPGYTVSYGGAFENLQAAQKRLSIAVPVSLVLIFLLLYFAFASVKQGLMIYSAIPLSAIGGILALVIRGMPFSISAGIGFIALFGVAVLNGIVLITEFNRLKSDGYTNVHRIVLTGTRVRLRPILLTATVASLGFIPMALSNGAGAEVQRPLATVVIGGLVSATFLTLFILPMLYVFVERKKRQASGSLPAIIILLILCSGGLSSSAQEPIALQAAIDTAYQNNGTIASSQLAVLYSQRLGGTAVDIPKTVVGSEWGQFNSPNFDTRLTVSQTINFPTVYARQKDVLAAQLERSKAELGLSKNQLRSAVTQAYYDLVLLRQKGVLLRYADGIYAEFLRRAEARFKAGETAVAEKAAAENQRQQIAVQLETLVADLSAANIRFNTLLSGRKSFTPKDTSFQLSSFLIEDFTAVNNASLAVRSKDVDIAERSWRLQQARLLPDLQIGYNNQSLVGIQNVNGVDKSYSAGNRFHSVQAGLSVSLFAGAQKARIKASKVQWQQAQVEYELVRQQTEAALRAALEQFKAQQQAIRRYQQTLLPNAAMIFKTAGLQFQNGEINYLEWVLLTNNAIGIQASYLESLRSAVNTQIQLELLTGKR